MTMNNPPNVAIIILNWNGWRDTIECLEAALQLTYPNFLLIVVDNGSWDGSSEKIRAWAGEALGKAHVFLEYTRAEALQGGKEQNEENFEHVASKSKMVLIRNEENLGFTGGCNVAFHYVLRKKHPADFCFLLNNDAKVDKECLIQLVSASREADAGIVGSVIKDEASGEIGCLGGYGNFPLFREYFHPIVRWPMPPVGVDEHFWNFHWVSGAGMLIRKDTLMGVYAITGNYFDDRLFLYGDEFSFCWTAREVGYTIIVSKRSIIYHKHAHSSGGRHSPIAYYYQTRNLIIRGREMLSLQLRILFYSFNLLHRSGQVLKNLLNQRFCSAWAIICGVWDGYRGTFGKWKYHDQAALKWRDRKR